MSEDSGAATNTTVRREMRREVLLPNVEEASLKRQKMAEMGEELDEASSSASTTTLTPQLWAKALDLLPFDDVLNFSIASKFCLTQVSPLVERLFVHRASNLLGSAARRRFSGVRKVSVTTLVSEIGPDHFETMERRRDQVHREAERPMSFCESTQITRRLYPNQFAFSAETCALLVPFLTSFPKLSYACIGGRCTCESEAHASWDEDNTRYSDIEYSVGLDEQYDDPRHASHMRHLIRQVCEAYASGVLSPDVHITGIIPFQRCEYTGLACVFSDEQDGRCSVCPLVSRSFPPLQVMQLQNDAVPCVEQRDRLEMALSRHDPGTITTQLTGLLKAKVENVAGRMAFLPPDFKEYGFVALYVEQTLQDMEFFIQHGADARDPAIRQILTTCTPDICGEDPMGFNGNESRRAFCGGAFRQLVEWNVDVSESDFLLVDLTDPRTDFRGGHGEVRAAPEEALEEPNDDEMEEDGEEDSDDE